MKIRFHSIDASSYVDGPGERTVLFMQGCPIHCLGCQNMALWPLKEGGRLEDVGEVARTLGTLATRHGNITISGGEPFAQPGPLAVLVALLKQAYRVQNIIVYTGYELEKMCSAESPIYMYLPQILGNIDVLVDGPFIHSLDDPYISWRGSRNQRVIDVPATLKAAAITTLDWDAVNVVVTPGGDAFMPVGLAGEFAEVGEVQATRRCGQR